MAHAEPDDDACVLVNAYPWIRALPEPDVHTFAAELMDAMGDGESVANAAAVSQLLIAWQHTAEAWADPDVLAALTKVHDGDYGPVPAPEQSGS